MISRLSITIIVDDAPGKNELVAEHGLSIWIEADDRRILFDTGQSDALAHNAKLLGIDLAEAHAIVLSHGHYDHTGGLSAVLEINKTADIYCHPGVVVPRYSLKPGEAAKPIGMPQSGLASLTKNKSRVQSVSAVKHISNEIGITGPIPRESTFEDTGGPFFLDPERLRPDPIEDDLAMWFNTRKGLVVLTGCCHSGIVNTVTYHRTLAPGKKIHLLIGGLHLLNASAGRLQRAIEFLDKSGINHIAPCHCTGQNVVPAIQSAFPAGFLFCATGSVFTIAGG
jgi:7,8-dihydropterin-6-yl-methyl-4-(beta-D-ribofuranosyl)aminobenzene 5'-phosphate synthase